MRSAKKAKVAVFAQGVDTASTETKVPPPLFPNPYSITCHAALAAK